MSKYQKKGDITENHIT